MYRISLDAFEDVMMPFSHHPHDAERFGELEYPYLERDPKDGDHLVFETRQQFLDLVKAEIEVMEEI